MLRLYYSYTASYSLCSVFTAEDKSVDSNMNIKIMLVPDSVGEILYEPLPDEPSNLSEAIKYIHEWSHSSTYTRTYS